MNRIAAAVTALSLALAARAEEPQPSQQEQQAPQQEQPADTAALEGRVAALEEQLAEAKGSLASLGRIKWSGYVQGRFAWLECVGNNTARCSYELVSEHATATATRDNFHLRRARLKVVYDADLAQLVLQVDAAPNAVTAKEAYASVKLPRGFAIDAGLQLLPFGYDVGVRSSSDLDLLERFRGAGQWLKGEYDLGVTLRASRGPFTLRAGVFNGNGVEGGKNWDNDQMKDVVGRLGVDFGIVTGGVSGWWGRTVDYTADPNRTFDRKRLGADAQIFLDLFPFGGTALKGELIVGTTAIADDRSAGADLGVTGHAWHATVTQNLGRMFLLAARYESYVRNNNLVAATETVKEIRQLDLALHAYVGGNYKLSALYSHPMDGETVGTGGTLAGSVKKTDQFVLQAQAKF